MGTSTGSWETYQMPAPLKNTYPSRNKIPAISQLGVGACEPLHGLILCRFCAGNPEFRGLPCPGRCLTSGFYRVSLPTCLTGSFLTQHLKLECPKASGSQSKTHPSPSTGLQVGQDYWFHRDTDSLTFLLTYKASLANLLIPWCLRVLLL